MQRDVATPDAYIAAVPEAQLALLQHLRSLIVKAAPKAREEIRYGALYYCDDAGGLFALAAQKNTVNLYVMATDAVNNMAEELKPIDHGKSCLRFKRLDQVPTAVISKLLRNAKQSSQRASAK